MVDVFTAAKRSEVMSRIKGKNTAPEMKVRSFLHARGLRYRLHDTRLPGSPDLTFPSRRVAVFVHGCFWHGHEGCRKAKLPATRTEFWCEKINGNIQRDRRQVQVLEKAGWTVLTIWQCDISDDVLGCLYKRIFTSPKS